MTVKEWLGEDNQLGIDIWHKKYQHENETFDEWLDRVSGGDSDIRQLIVEKKFLFGGRILSSRGLDKLGKKVSLSNCFVAGQKIITKRGLLNIEDVKIGDEVITEDGTWQFVSNTLCRDYQGDLYEFRSNALYSPLICTPNHKLLTNNGWKRADRILACSKRITGVDRLALAKSNYGDLLRYDDIDVVDGFKEDEKIRIKENPDGTVQVEKMIESDNYASHWRQGGHPVRKNIPLTKDLRYLIGRWIGDGSVTKRKGNSLHSITQIVFNERFQDACYRCAEIFETHFGIKPQIRHTDQHILALRVESEIIGSWFFRNFGEKCDGKFIPDKYKGDLEIVKGLLDADSCIKANGGLKIVLKNKALIEWLRDSLYLNGIPTSDIKKIERYEGHFLLEVQTGISRGRLLPHLSRTYHDGRHNKRESKSINSDFIVIDDILIHENTTCKVYNLSIETKHSYSVNGVIVHNCYVLETNDSLESIMDCASKMARTYASGGGCGVDLSKLAPRGAKINNAAKETSGAVSFMELYSTVTGLIGQGGRRAALMLSLDCSHPDIEEFIDIKSDLNKITKANISVRLTDEFMQAVVDNTEHTLSFTREETGEVIEKKVNARELFKKIADANWSMAEPGALFWDRITSWNMLSEFKDFEYAGVNPCGLLGLK